MPGNENKYSAFATRATNLLTGQRTNKAAKYYGNHEKMRKFHGLNTLCGIHGHFRRDDDVKLLTIDSVLMVNHLNITIQEISELKQFRFFHNVFEELNDHLKKSNLDNWSFLRRFQQWNSGYPTVIT